MAYKKSKPETTPTYTVPCAHDLCPNPGIVRLKLPTGWAVLCRKHYDFHIQREADAFCLASGLDTFEKKRSYCLQKMLMLGKVDPVTHWQKVLETEGLPLHTYKSAREALKFLQYRGRDAA